MSEPAFNLDPFEDFESASQAVVGFLRMHLGFKLLMVTRTQGDDWIVLHASDGGYGIDRGEVFQWTDTLCAKMIAGDGPRVAPRIADVPVYAESPLAQMAPLGSYI